MKIILSRKGFDTQNGGQASPIMPDGTLLSLPIPSKAETLRFSQLKYQKKTYLEIIKELKPSTYIKDYYACHLDPDLRCDAIQRDKEWEPLFGQTGSAQGHLTGKDIKEGDLFLFFGTFRKTELNNDLLKYVRGAPNLHVIFGYLQIREIYSDLKIISDKFPYHPHSHERYNKEKNNRLYRANQKLSFCNDISGSGCFRFHDDLVLTKKNYPKSRWDLPKFFKINKVDISYHEQSSFILDYFQSASIGQEFVIEENNDVTEWAKKIIRSGTNVYL